MALPSGGPLAASTINIELKRPASAGFSMNGADERSLAGKSTGAISFSDFHGKETVITRTLAGGDGAVTLEGLFTNADWVSTTPKRVILATGTERGNSTTLSAAVSIGTTAWGGTLTFDVNGTISGKGGATNSGVGGDAFSANIVGASGQKIILNVAATGVIRGGGGGGGQGGAGGAGTFTTQVREPASGSYQSVTSNPKYYWCYNYQGDTSQERTILYWAGSQIYTAETNKSPGPVAVGGYNYYGISSIPSGPGVGSPNKTSFVGIYRVGPVTTATTGGVGGEGGRGQGYDGARVSGSVGTAGGTNAGAGGTGGQGGLFGSSGAPGATGANGNVSNGVAGSSGGLSGYAIANYANITITNNGSIVGRT